MKILLCSKSLRREYGGPAVSVPRLAQSLSALGHEVAVWAQDGSTGNSDILNSEDHVEKLEGSISKFIAGGLRADVVHDNGIWLPHNHSIARCCRKYDVCRVVSIRGMLEPWAVNHNPLRKKISWLTYQRHDLVTANGIHVTSQLEEDNVAKFRLGKLSFNIPNGVDIPVRSKESSVELVKDAVECGNKKVALFLSRVHPKKGLNLLLESWLKIQPENWILRIVGPDEDGYTDKLAAYIKDMNLQQSVELVGPKYQQDKIKEFERANLFILPTYSENFGIAVAEALAFGIPVITTTGTPWKMLAEIGCGWYVEPDVESISIALEKATCKSEGDLRKMGSRGRELMLTDYSWSSIAKRFEQAYSSLLKTE